MNSYLSLVPISAKVHKRQSRMTRICIILAVFLVTSIFSMTEMWLDAEKTTMLRKHGNYHIVLENIPEDTAACIRGQSDVASSSWYDAINPDGKQDYFINGKKTVLYGIEQSYLSDIRNYSLEDAWPKSDSEAVLSADAKELFGYRTGDLVTVTTPAGDLSYRIAGFCQDDTEFNKIIDGCCLYLSRPAFHEVCSLNGVDSAPQYYIQFRDHVNLRRAIDAIKQQYALTTDHIDENTAVMGLAGASTNESVKNIYPLAFFCFVLILIAGVLMISSCMNSNVSQRTRFFGMMRCIGASKQQIIRFVRLEALNWCKTAIPTGCLLGVVTCWIVCAILRFMVKGEWADMPLFGVSISGIICGAAVGVITVFLAAHSPAKQAAKVSPVSAVSGNTAVAQTIRHGVRIRFFGVETSLGIHHAVESGKNLFLMTGSFALTIMLFLTFSACLDVVHKLLPSVSNFTSELSIASRDDTNSIDQSTVAKIAEMSGVQSTFGTMLVQKHPVLINGKPGTIDLFSYGEFMLDKTKKSVASGSLSKIYGDSGYALTVFDKGNPLNVGDKIKIGNEEIEIACVASEGLGTVSGAAAVFCSEETFTRLTGEDQYTIVSIMLNHDAPEATVKAIRQLAGDNVFTDSREESSEVFGSYWVFRIAAYSFLAIISFITVLNIMNSISMGVSARMKQYGTMRAVGMENRQITKMITAEAVTYAACGMIAGFLFGLLLHYLIYMKVIITHFGGTWKVPISSMAILILLVSGSCVLAVYAPSKRMRKMEIIATINEL